jgi:hypothetical protein
MHTSGFSLSRDGELAAAAETPPLDDAKLYATEVPDRYRDLHRSDEGDARFAYEHGRARLFVKGRSNQHVPKEYPSSASQENYVETTPATPAELGGGGGGVHRGSPLQVSASCATCRSCLSCGEGEGDFFCSGCNAEALRSAPTTSRH